MFLHVLHGLPAFFKFLHFNAVSKNSSNTWTVSSDPALCLMNLVLSASGYLEGEVEVFLYVSLVAQQLSQTVSQLLHTDTTTGFRFNRLREFQSDKSFLLQRMRKSIKSFCFFMHLWEKPQNLHDFMLVLKRLFNHFRQNIKLRRHLDELKCCSIAWSLSSNKQLIII